MPSMEKASPCHGCGRITPKTLPPRLDVGHCVVPRGPCLAGDPKQPPRSIHTLPANVLSMERETLGQAILGWNWLEGAVKGGHTAEQTPRTGTLSTRRNGG